MARERRMPNAKRGLSRTGAMTRRRLLQVVSASAAAASLHGIATAADAPAKPGKRLERKAKATLTPFGLNFNDTLRFLLRNGRVWEMTLLKTSAEVIKRHPA